MRKLALLCLFAISGALIVVAAEPAGAHAPSGAIFTTVIDGTEVNFNHYDAKEDVYLDGGPGPGAPQHAAGLDDGVYVFQVTDPSGKVLLSQDAAKCRLVQVEDNIFTSLAPSDQSCVHNHGTDVDHNALTVQLMPYADTPNPGGVYKAWVTFLEDYTCDLNVVDCGSKPGNRHGFVPAHSKTDNFKVKNEEILEIDTRFFRDADNDGYSDSGTFMDGLGVTWTDTLGASNHKWSYYDPAHMVIHEAHVEAVETGTHTITVDNQAGCTVGSVFKDGVKLKRKGPQSVSFSVTASTGNTTDTLRLDVACI